MRILALCLAAAAAVPAVASYELMLLPDINTNRVARFDPVNNVSLGTFGPFTGTSGIYANYRTNGNTYVTSGAGTTAYNTSNGLPVMQGTFPNSRTVISPQGNRLLESSGIALYRTDANTLSQNSFTMSGSATIEQMIPLGDFLWGIVHRTAADPTNFVLQTYDSATQTLSSAFTIGSNFTVGSFGSGQTVLDSSGNATYRCSARNSLGGLQLMTFRYNTSGAWTLNTAAPSSFVNYGAGASVAILPAHQGYYAIGDDASNANHTRFTYLSATNHAALGGFLSTTINVPSTNWGASVIVAPEPGSAAMLGLGALSLLARRRRHR